MEVLEHMAAEPHLTLLAEDDFLVGDTYLRPVITDDVVLTKIPL